MRGVPLFLDDKVALITGGSRGIGAATVRLFAEAGARVAFSFTKAAQQAEDLVRTCAKDWGGDESSQPRYRAFQQELSSASEGRALVEAVVSAFGRLDVLVVNHGIWPAQDAPIAEMAEAQWRHTMGVNLDSVFGLVQAAVAQMLRQERLDPNAATGHIVLISSTAGQRGRGQPRRLRRDQRRADQSHQEPVERVGG